VLCPGAVGDADRGVGPSVGDADRGAWAPTSVWETLARGGPASATGARLMPASTGAGHATRGPLLGGESESLVLVSRRTAP